MGRGRGSIGKFIIIGHRLVDCWTLTFPNVFSLSLPTVSILQLSANVLILSPTWCCNFPDQYSFWTAAVTLHVLMSLLLCMVWSPQFYFVFLIVCRICSTFVCSLFHDARFMSLHVISNPLLSSHFMCFSAHYIFLGAPNFWNLL